MAVARMRHYNSPEEVAARQGVDGQPVASSGRKEFRHYNHPEEVAKRARAGQAGGRAVVPTSKRQLVQTTAEPWPPAGTVDNTASVTASVPTVASATAERMKVLPDDEAASLPERRLRRLEAYVFTFLDSVDEAREFRRLLNNQAAVADLQLDINNRVRALEDWSDDLIKKLGGDDDDLLSADAAPPEDKQPSEPPDTRPDVPKLEGST